MKSTLPFPLAPSFLWTLVDIPQRITFQNSISKSRIRFIIYKAHVPRYKRKERRKKSKPHRLRRQGSYRVVKKRLAAKRRFSKANSRLIRTYPHCFHFPSHLHKEDSRPPAGPRKKSVEDKTENGRQSRYHSRQPYNIIVFPIQQNINMMKKKSPSIGCAGTKYMKK